MPDNAANSIKPLFLLLASLCVPAFAAAPPPRQNVLLICVDDLKPLLGCYGEKGVQSPNIDRLAKRSLLFERAFCNQAVCAPSRNALMTGLRPTTVGIYDLGTHFRRASSNAVTLSQYFMQHGYRAEALGKIFHGGHGNHEDPPSWSVPHFQARSIAYLLPESRSNESPTREEALFANQTDVAKLPRGAAYEAADVPDNAYIGANRGYAKELFAAIAPLKLWWTSQCTADVAFDDEFLSLAARSGCNALFLGLETISQASLNL